MVVVFHSVLAFSFHVPELDVTISTGRKDESSILRNSTGKNFLGVTFLNEAPSGLTTSQIPESQGTIPRG